MAIEKVTAQVGENTYALRNTQGDTYNAAVRAPATESDYGVTIVATDESGNKTTVDDTDERLGEKLRLSVIPPIEKEDLRKSILTNELGNQMLDMVAPVYDNAESVLYLFQCFGKILQKEQDFISGDFIAQIFPQTATWGLKYWEDEYGIVTDESKTIEHRRAYLMSVMFKKKPMTPHRIEEIVKGVTGIECEVQENIAPNTFRVIIRGYVTDLNPVKKELDKKTPAHLIYTIRMAELIEMETMTTATGFAVSESERYKLEVLN